MRAIFVPLMISSFTLWSSFLTSSSISCKKNHQESQIKLCKSALMQQKIERDRARETEGKKKLTMLPNQFTCFIFSKSESSNPLASLLLFGGFTLFNDRNQIQIQFLSVYFFLKRCTRGAAMVQQRKKNVWLKSCIYGQYTATCHERFT